MPKRATVARLLFAISLAALWISAIGSPSSAFAQQPPDATLPADKAPDQATVAGGTDDAMLPVLKIEREVLQKSLLSVNEDIEKQLREFDKLDVDTADLTNQESELDEMKAIIRRIGTQLSLWNLELEAEQRIKVMDAASRPQADDAVTRDLVVGIAGIVGFCVGLLLAALLPWRRWVPAVGLAVLLGGLSASMAWVVTPLHYEAQALIKVGRLTPVVLQNVGGGGAEDPETYGIFKETQLQLLKSNFVLGRAARKSEMAALRTMQEHKDDPVGFLDRSLIVDYPGDAELMRVTMKGEYRDELPRIVNAVVDSYMDEIVSGDKVARLRQKDLLAQHYSAKQESFRVKMDKWKKLARELRASSSESAQMRKKIAEQRLEATVASANTLTQRIRDVEIQISILKERKAKAADAGPK